jgi:hypothetical protein
MEDCKFCRPDAAKPQQNGRGRGTLAEGEGDEGLENPAAGALQECLETMERVRLLEQVRCDKYPSLMEHYHSALRKGEEGFLNFAARLTSMV